MKKVFITLIAVLALGLGVKAQSNLGIRVGTGTELSFQTNLNSMNRLEFDLGLDGIFNNHDWQYWCLSAAYQWHFGIVEKLGWYIGPAAQAGFYTWKGHNSELGLAIGGQIGLDYVLPIPLQLSLDARPLWILTDNDYHSEHFGWSVCLGVRYMF